MRCASLLQLLLGFLERLAAERPQFVLALEQHLLAERLLDLPGVHLRDALEALAHALGKIADGVARLFDGGGLAREALLLLLELVVEERERLLVGADLAQLHLDLDLPPVEIPVHLRALGLDFLLDLAFQLLGADRGLAPGHLEQLGGILLRHAARVARDEPDNQQTHARAGNAGDHEGEKKRLALENQQDEVGCAS